MSSKEKEEILESIKFWEEMLLSWKNNPQWSITAPNYPNVVAEIVKSRLKYLNELATQTTPIV